MKPRFDQQRFSEITGRWKSVQLIERWRALTPAARESVLGDMEETSRQMRDTHPELADDYAAALDALDVISVDGALGLWSQAADDVKWLLEEVSRLRGQ